MIHAAEHLTDTLCRDKTPADIASQFFRLTPGSKVKIAILADERSERLQKIWHPTTINFRPEVHCLPSNQNPCFQGGEEVFESESAWILASRFLHATKSKREFSICSRVKMELRRCSSSAVTAPDSSKARSASRDRIFSSRICSSVSGC